ncbi:metalloregulator ArsR/SmtB family transcription factor [Mycolicibacterium goodii]|uniref:ArsR/SmtB family transcription factor n=1 Tax=Mycolicibacterium goodii TaxID=134601 RepID=UPI001BDD27F3|nr:metalloregulator ArsR/SmtB family transcription factor [Mycolicibacterium goodii]MBU8816212.1 metalloregulator ArsR/SmtB family transcription factor [Mycolicibacterium goodii]
MREAQELATATEADIASVAALLSDPARCKVLLALDDGRALPTSVLAEEAGISRATASSHLAKLTEAGLLAVRSQGRHRYYRLAGPEVAALIEQLGRLAPARPVTSLREGTRAARLRSARTCYDHIAGRLGVQIMGRLLELEILTGGDGLFHADGADRLSAPGHDVTYELTENGARALTRMGIELPFGSRPLVRYCVDWSEQRHHVAGRLGRAILDRFLTADWVRRAPRHRALTVTQTGREALADLFGIDWTG